MPLKRILGPVGLALMMACGAEVPDEPGNVGGALGNAGGSRALTTAPTVTLLSPRDGERMATTNVTFQCSAESSEGLQQITLWYGTPSVQSRVFREDAKSGVVVDDTTLVAKSAKRNFGGETSVSVDGNPVKHALIRFSGLFGSGVDQLPPGTRIDEARVVVRCVDAGDTMVAYRLLEDWTEGQTTWLERKAGVPWSNPGANGAASRDTTGIVWSCPAAGERAFDATSFVRAWADGAPNHGIVVIPTGGDLTRWNSNEHTTTSSRPRLEVSWVELGDFSPRQSVAVSGSSATVSFSAALSWNTRYLWSCEATDATGARSRAPTSFELTVEQTPSALRSVATAPDLKVAFIGDQGLGPNAVAVLQLIRGEGADAVLHQGDFEYEDNPAAWEEQINSVLGPDFPYFVSIGNHDEGQWTEYQRRALERAIRVGATCEGDYGVMSACHYQGLYFVLVGPDIMGSGHDLYIRDRLTADASLWSVCSWHKLMRLMQVEGKNNETGWGVYEECRRGGAIVATAHAHSYSRTHLMGDFDTQTVVSTATTLTIDRGRTIAFVSGLGGRSIRAQRLDGHWWASIYTATQGATYGALFCTFNVAGHPERAACYFKDIRNRVIDQFGLEATPERAVNLLPVASAGADVTQTDVHGDGAETITLDGRASVDPDGTIVSYSWREGLTVLGTSATLTRAFPVGRHTVTLLVVDDDGATASDTVVVTVNAGSGGSSSASGLITISPSSGATTTSSSAAATSSTTSTNASGTTSTSSSGGVLQGL
ncbi:MAG: DNRLRE domain-containing protein [Myxococcota bacterium]